MKTYSNNLEYQGLQAACEQSKIVFETAKAEKKVVESALNALKKEKKPSKPQLHLLKFQLQQAKLKGKSEKLNAQQSKFQLKEWVTNFKKKHNEVALKEESPLGKRKKTVKRPLEELNIQAEIAVTQPAKSKLEIKRVVKSKVDKTQNLTTTHK